MTEEHPPTGTRIDESELRELVERMRNVGDTYWADELQAVLADE